MRIPIASLLLSLGLLGGCESTRFEAPPVAQSTGDEALFGRWLSVGDRPDEMGEVELRIEPHGWGERDAESGIDTFNFATLLTFVENKKEGTVTGEATRLGYGHDGDRHYLWVDANWAEVRMGEKPRANKGDVFVFRYRVRGDRLEVWQVDTNAIAHRVIDNQLKGDVHQADDELHVRLKAPVDPKALRARGFWDEDVLLFERAPVDAKDD